jgi:hypothetical protein
MAILYLHSLFHATNVELKAAHKRSSSTHFNNTLEDIPAFLATIPGIALDML